MQFGIRGIIYADENEAKKTLVELYTSGIDEIEDSGNISNILNYFANVRFERQDGNNYRYIK
jgi:hypothetical protein